MPAETPAKATKPASGPAIQLVHVAAGKRMRCSDENDDRGSYTVPKPEAISPDEYHSGVRRRKGGPAAALLLSKIRETRGLSDSIPSDGALLHDHSGEHIGLRHDQEADQAGERDRDGIG